MIYFSPSGHAFLIIMSSTATSTDSGDSDLVTSQRICIAVLLVRKAASYQASEINNNDKCRVGWSSHKTHDACNEY